MSSGTPCSGASSERRIVRGKYQRRADEMPLQRYRVAGPAALVLALALQPRLVLACAACYGQDSGPMAQGMNWGIFSLLGIIVFVLGGVAGFFVYLANRSAPGPAEAVPQKLASSSEGI
jgi:heme/copper-type cytochrome/quinol oxidase subunit 2